MDKVTRERALRLLSEKKSDPGITYSDIEVETGYSRRQLMRLSKRLDEVGFSSESHFSYRFKKVVGLSPRAYRTA